MTTIVNEIWIAMARLACQAKDIGRPVSNGELKAAVGELFDDHRPGVYTHINQHVVAQKRLNTGFNKCYLSAVGKGLRRLFLPGDSIHESRQKDPKTKPEPHELPPEYRYLLTWHLEATGQTVNIADETQRQDSKIRKSPSGTKDDGKRTYSISEFVSRFHEAHENFYASDATFKRFREGPCIHFHRKAITLWRVNIQQGKRSYRSFLTDDDYIEAIYATLTAWGMNKLGGGPKLVNYDDFKATIISIGDYLEEIRNLDILTIDGVKEIVGQLYSAIRPSPNIRNLVVKSKTLHHLHPELFPPIDNSYTLSTLTRLRGFDAPPTRHEVDFENFWKVTSCFRLLISSVGQEVIRSYIGRGIMDTSMTKIIDNAIVGFKDLTGL